MFYSYLMFVILISDLNIFFYLNEEAGNNYPCHHSLSNKLTTLCNEAFLISMNHPLLKRHWWSELPTGCAFPIAAYVLMLQDFFLLVKDYLFCVSPALTLIFPTISSGFLSRPPQGMMVCTRLHMFFHRAGRSQCKLSNIRSPKSRSRVIRKV